MATLQNIKADQYTSGGEFTLNGADYVGFFNVSNNKAYTGRKQTTTSQLLEVTNNVKSSFYVSDHYFDRFITDVITLEYSLDDILVDANDLVNAQVFNTSIDRLFQNFIFLYSRAFISSNQIPDGYQSWYGLVSGGSDLTWNTTSVSTSAVQSASGVGLSEFDNAKNTVYVQNTDTDKLIGFTTSDTHMMVIESSSDLSSSSITLSSDKTFAGSQIEFKNITDMAVDTANNRLYVCDGGANAIYKYDIEGFVTNNKAKLNRFILKKTVGGSGDDTAKIKFDNPTVLSFFNDELYVFDSGNKVLKVFDKYLNYKRTIRKNDFRDSSVVDINVHPSHNVAYVLTQSKNIICYDLNFEQRTSVDYTSFLNSTESIIGIEFSRNDSNICYILTDENIYKCLLNKLNNGPVGRFQLSTNNISGETFKDLDILDDETSQVDKILAIGTSKILLFNETSNYQSVLGIDNFNIYLKDDIFVDGGEYVQAWVYNKEIYKILTNIYKFRNNILGRFVGQYNSDNEVIFDGFRYLTDAELVNVASSPGPDFYIHANEDPTPAIMNRALAKIYELEDELRSLINGKVLNTFPIDGQPVVIS